MALRLGKLPPRHDPRTLRLSSYLRKGALPPIPAAFDWTKGVSPWGVLANDSLGDCAIASPMHQIMAMAGQSKQANVSFTDADAIKYYSAITGYVPGNPSTDNGSVMLDVMNFWRQVGFNDHKVAAYVKVDHTNLPEVYAALYLFGGLQAGVNLPKAAQNLVGPGKVWTGPIDPRSARGQWAPGSWGGHAIPILAKDTQHLTCVTWGALQLMSGYFFADYADELYAVVSPDWFGPDGKAPSGFDVQLLWSHLNDVTDGSVTIPPPPPAPTPVPPAPTPVAGKLTVTLSIDAASKTATVLSVV